MRRSSIGLQRAPDLFTYLHLQVDERPAPGRFVRTGSQHRAWTTLVTQSLAGRPPLLALYPPGRVELLQIFCAPTESFEVL